MSLSIHDLTLILGHFSIDVNTGCSCYMHAAWAGCSGLLIRPDWEGLGAGQMALLLEVPGDQARKKSGTLS
jgi:hypothetical protein